MSGWLLGRGAGYDRMVDFGGKYMRQSPSAYVDITSIRSRIIILLAVSNGKYLDLDNIGLDVTKMKREERSKIGTNQVRQAPKREREKPQTGYLDSHTTNKTKKQEQKNCNPNKPKRQRPATVLPSAI